MRDDLIKTFIDQIYLEKEIEKFKSELAHSPDFSIMECFKLFDRSGSGFLTLSDLKDTLLNLLGHEYKSNEETYLLFKRFDRD